MQLTRRRRRQVLFTAAYVVLLVWLIPTLFPFYWMVLTSIKPTSDIFANPPLFRPSAIVLDHYQSAFAVTPMAHYLINSLIVALSTTALSIILAGLSGYAFARFTFRGKQAALLLILLTQMFPAALLVIPMFIILNDLHLIDTYGALIIADTTFALPFSIWMLKGFFASIPSELDDAARIDGCSRLQAFWRIILPLAAPGLAATACFAFILSWNEFLFALNFTASDSARTIPVGLALAVSPYYNDWGRLNAQAVMFTVPTLLLFLAMQKYLVKGLTAGAVKG